MSTKLLSVELKGLEGVLVEVEVDRRRGRPVFTIVGLADTAVQEAKERVTSAIKNSNFEFPRGKVIINLAPADTKKVGPRYDLAIAVGILDLMGFVNIKNNNDLIMIGELALNGSLRRVNGILSSVEFAKQQGFKKIIIAKENLDEAILIPDIEIIAIENLRELVDYLNNKKHINSQKTKKIKINSNFNVDMADIKGQAQAKRAMEISAAGGHNLILSGTPGSGKTLMAKALVSILPTMNLEEILEVSKIYSVSGLLSETQPLITQRPFRQIHHTASAVSIVGGGSTPNPGEISLAHRGVLFMDEIAEFPKNVLDVLRQPMEDNQIIVSRAKGVYKYPCQFTLIAAMNPCPCGYLNAENSKKICTCSNQEIQKYKKKISGPLMDRIDMLININPINYEKLNKSEKTESSEEIKKRTEKARKIQEKRFKNDKIHCNAEMNNKHIKKHCILNKESNNLMKLAMQEMNISARVYFKILKMSRTIADLENNKNIETKHLAEALQYRSSVFNE